ncbi:MAG: OB-fold nucleic acid binding domain-containing protein [Propionibacteriaceae bacterium]|nr:OB-fold nucleic acid binding domain-containing protein [Propionibacteriaceae bacterium]
MGETRPRQGGLLGALRRMMSSTAERDADALRRQAEAIGARRIADCTDRDIVLLRGTIKSATTAPAEQPPRLEAHLDDGSGVVTLIWMGRRTISGIRPGAILRVEGRLSNDRGERRIYNPRYELIRVPDAG